MVLISLTGKTNIALISMPTFRVVWVWGQQREVCSGHTGNSNTRLEEERDMVVSVLFVYLIVSASDGTTSSYVALLPYTRVASVF